MIYKAYDAKGDAVFGAADWEMLIALIRLWGQHTALEPDIDSIEHKSKAVLWSREQDAASAGLMSDAFEAHMKEKVEALSVKGTRKRAVKRARPATAAPKDAPNPQPMVKSAPKSGAKPRMSKAAAKKASVLEGK